MTHVTHVRVRPAGSAAGIAFYLRAHELALCRVAVKRQIVSHVCVIAATLACWLVVGAMLLAVIARATHIDERSMILIGLSTALPVVLLPAYLVLPLALLRGQGVLATVAAVLVIVHLVVATPLVHGARQIPSAVAGSNGRPLRVLALNVRYDADTGARISAQVERYRPDIVVLSELSPLTLSHLSLPQYPYHWERPHTDPFGAGVWSRYPVSLDVWAVNGYAMIRGDVDVDGVPVRLYQVHTTAPRTVRSIGVWRAQLATIGRAIRAESGDVVVAGDFNASRTDRGFAGLLGGPEGFADAADGRGLQVTWPSTPSIPRLLRLDHVLVSRRIGVRSVRVLPAVGSDHRAVLADLVIPSASKPGT